MVPESTVDYASLGNYFKAEIDNYSKPSPDEHNFSKSLYNNLRAINKKYLIEHSQTVSVLIYDSF